MSAATVWWVTAGVLVAVELGTGTFYLLMLALGAAAGALAAHAGLATAGQIVVAAAVGALATATWHLRRARAPRSAPAEANRDVVLDIGSPVRVAAWEGDGTARVAYRGATWAARHAGPGAPQPGEHVIVAVHGSELLVRAAAEPSKP